MNGNLNGTPAIAGNGPYRSRASGPLPEMPPAPLSPSCNWRQAVPTALTNAGTGMPSVSAAPPPVTLESTDYLAGLLTTMVGEQVRVQFLIGTTGPMVDVLGTLMEVGANYIVIQPVASDDLMICDLYSIKFVTVLK